MASPAGAQYVFFEPSGPGVNISLTPDGSNLAAPQPGSANIEITSGEAPVVTARVFNDAGAAGTTGFTEPAMRPEEALQSGQTGVLLMPPDFAVARFNIGVRTLEDGASVTFTLGTVKGQQTVVASVAGKTVQFTANAQ